MISFLLWRWHDPNWQSTYTAEHVNIMADCIRRNYKRPHKIYCITDDSAGIRRDINIIPMWNHAKELGHCYRRLFAFSREFAKMMPEKFCSIDLDCVITGDITELVDSAGDFAIMKDALPQHPYNGSFWVHQPGTRVDVWDKFIADPQGMIAKAKQAGLTSCDQSQMALIMGKNEKVFTEADGVYSYKYGVKRLGGLPANAKLIALHGNPKPWDKVGQSLSWVQEHYGYTNRAIVLGGGTGVWQELDALTNIKDSASIIAINDAGCAYPGKLDYWVTLHPQKMPAWIQKRKEAGFNMNFITVGHGDKPEFTDEVSLCWRSKSKLSGSSGLFACQTALEKGFEEIILCGVPMNGDKNIFRGKEWTDFVGYRQAWLDNLVKIEGKVVSQSGWTADLLGTFERPKVKKKRAIVFGGAASVWADFESVKHLHDTSDIIVCNDAGWNYSGKVKYWVSLHTEEFPVWLEKRKAAGFDMNLKTIGFTRDFEPQPGCDELRGAWGSSEGKASGSTGLFAVEIALDKGYDEIILCGCPINEELSIFNGYDWHDFANYRQAWLDKLDKIKGKVYSQSGWTKDLLGSFI